MSLSQIFKKVLIPCAAGVTSSEGHTHGPNCTKKAESGTRPSDLPIYSKQCSICGEANSNPSPPGGMEETVGNIRRELWVWQDSLRGYRHKIVDVYRRGFSKADCPDTDESNARNHLDRSFDEKSYHQPSSCQHGRKPITDFRGFRSAWSTPPNINKPCVDRCGKPCSGEHRHDQCQAPQKPARPCGRPAPAPPPCEKPKSPPCQKARSPEPKRAPQCQHHKESQPHLCEHKQPNPPCEGSRKTKDYCCQRPECSGQK